MDADEKVSDLTFLLALLLFVILRPICSMFWEMGLSPNLLEVLVGRPWDR